MKRNLGVLSSKNWIGVSMVAGAVALAGCNSGGSGAGLTSGGGGGELATVGTTSVSRAELLSALEAENGARVAMGLLDYHLVLELAKGKGIVVSDEEVDKVLQSRQLRNPGIAQVLAMGGAQADQLRRQIRQEIAGQRLVIADVKTDEAKAQAFFNKYAATWYDEPVRVKFGALFSSTKPRAELMSRQLAAKTKSFQELVDEQKKADDPAAQQSSANSVSPVGEPVDNFPQPAKSQLASIAVGGHTGVTTIPNQNVYAIFRLEERTAKKKAVYAELKPEVELDFKLAQVAEKINGANPANPPFDQALQQTRGYLMNQLRGEVTLRDVLSFIVQTEVNRLVSQNRNTGLVKITDPEYQMLAPMFQAPAGAAGAAAPAAGEAPAGAGAPAPATP